MSILLNAFKSILAEMPSTKLAILAILALPPLLFVIAMVEIWFRRRRARRRPQYHSQEAREARQRAHELRAPIPLPKIRPRALTLRFPGTSNITPPSHSKQAQSRLFAKLPLELRELIYVEVLRGDGAPMHIVRKENNRLGHLRCKDRCYEQTDRCTGYMNGDTGDWGPAGDCVETHGGLLPLLRTCRRM